MFKVGQKLVCISTQFMNDVAGEFAPNYMEIVTFIEQSDVFDDSILIKEYPITSCGHPNHFRRKLFRPLYEVLSEISISELTEQISPVLCPR